MALVRWLKQRLSREPSEPGPEVILYTRKSCHLCEDARAVLEAHGLDPKPVDIDADPKLVELYNTCVPVVMIDGRVYFRGRVNPVLLRRVLSQHTSKRR